MLHFLAFVGVPPPCSCHPVWGRGSAAPASEALWHAASWRGLRRPPLLLSIFWGLRLAPQPPPSAQALALRAFSSFLGRLRSFLTFLVFCFLLVRPQPLLLLLLQPPSLCGPGSCLGPIPLGVPLLSQLLRPSVFALWPSCHSHCTPSFFLLSLPHLGVLVTTQHKTKRERVTSVSRQKVCIPQFMG